MSGGIITAAITNTVGSIMQGLDGLFTSDEERLKVELALQKQLMQPQIIQAMTTLQEAEHPSRLVAGWRPALGWVCAAGLAWEFVLRQLIGAAMIIASYWVGEPAKLVSAAADLPQLNAEPLMALVAILLGVAGYRTLEKTKGVARNNLR